MNNLCIIHSLNVTFMKDWVRITIIKTATKGVKHLYRRNMTHPHKNKFYELMFDSGINYIITIYPELMYFYLSITVTLILFCIVTIANTM